MANVSLIVLMACRRMEVAGDASRPLKTPKLWSLVSFEIYCKVHILLDNVLLRYFLILFTLDFTIFIFLHKKHDEMRNHSSAI